MSAAEEGSEELFTPAEVARMFRVDPKTVTRWAVAGRLTTVRTPGEPPPVPGRGGPQASPGRAGRRGDVSAAADDIELLSRGEVAALCRVDPVTVTRWADTGRLLCTRTPGGTRRYFGSQVRALLRGDDPQAARKLAEADQERLAGGAP